ncbi:MAG TPA: PAS domain S-box protein [candidate division Zixibacteria bacterium]|nr:PAS domain S-box protein [candidate division Zixibacteria bacterium]
MPAQDPETAAIPESAPSGELKASLPLSECSDHDSAGLRPDTIAASTEQTEESRRAEALVGCAAALFATLDEKAVRIEITSRLADLLRAKLVALLEKSGSGWRASSVFSAIDTDVLSDPVRLSIFGQNLVRELAKDGWAVVDLATDARGLPQQPQGKLLVVSLEIGGETALLLACCGPDHMYGQQEIATVRAIAGVGALAVQNAALYRQSDSQAQELKQLLEVVNELADPGKIEGFLERFAVRTANFLNFKRSFIALILPDGRCHVIYLSNRESEKVDIIEVPPEMRDRLTGISDVLWSDDASEIGLDFPQALRLQLKQVVAAPLKRADGRVLGVLGVLDRADGAPIGAEDIRRARALAGQVALVLESRQNLLAADAQRRRAENLIAMAFDISTSLRVPDLVRVLGTRASDMLGGESVVVALARGTSLEAVFMEPSLPEPNMVRRLNAVLTELASRGPEMVRCADAKEVVGEFLSEALGWQDVIVARLRGTGSDLIGLLCIANRGRALTSDERNILQALVSHASVALDNSRLFSRIANSNSQWTEIFDSITDFIVVHDNNFRVLRVNRSMADFIGVRPQELIGVNMRALMALAQESTSGSCPFCRSGAEPDDEFMHPVLERVYLVSNSIIHGALEEGQQTIHVLKDITDRREAERRYREIFDNIQEGLFFCTPEGRLVEVNDAMVRMLGYSSREELLQVDIPTGVYVNGDDRTRKIHETSEGGVVRNLEQKLRRKDGSVIYALENSFAVRDAQGKIVQYRGVLLDITELKNFQSELQRQRDFNDKILNNTQSLIMVIDTAGLIAYANRRCYDVGGYPEGTLVGKPLVELIAAEKRALLKKALAWTLVGQPVDNLELPFLLGGQRTGRFSVNLSPVRDDDQQVNSIVVVMSDITQEAVLKAKLMHTEKMAAVGQLVSGVAHEVNNPLTAILGFADLLASRTDINADCKPDLEIIIQEAQRTKQIVQNLLSFARQTPPQREPLQVNELLRRTLQLRSYDLSNSGVDVVADYQEPAPDVVCDQHQLQQVFLNIVNNAFDALREIPQGVPKLEIQTRYRDEWAEIRFRDNGPGMVSAERVFDPFYTTKEVGKGTGLGLSICYGIVREHGGEITAANSPDGGAVFTVRLPLSGESQLQATEGREQ